MNRSMPICAPFKCFKGSNAKQIKMKRHKSGRNQLTRITNIRNKQRFFPKNTNLQLQHKKASWNSNLPSTWTASYEEGWSEITSAAARRRRPARRGKTMRERGRERGEPAAARRWGMEVGAGFITILHTHRHIQVSSVKNHLCTNKIQ